MGEYRQNSAVVGEVSATADQNEARQVDQLIRLFNRLFMSSHNTILVRGKGEPIYIPASDEHPQHRIIFAHGFFNSALHEIAHWCVAGKQRRQWEDFGYWYAPDGRNLVQQKKFEQVEVAPQALEWIFTRCSGRRFRVSTDNLQLLASGVQHDDQPFKEKVYQEVNRRLQQGLPNRARVFAQALIEQYQPGFVLTKTAFKLEDL